MREIVSYVPIGSVVVVAVVVAVYFIGRAYEKRLWAKEIARFHDESRRLSLVLL